MRDTKELGAVELESLIVIQEEMLDEHRRLRYLTVWLIIVTVLLLGVYILAAACSL
jgi:hypothetical protein